MVMLEREADEARFGLGREEKQEQKSESVKLSDEAIKQMELEK